MSHLLLENTKNKLKDFITDTKYPDNKYQDKLVILKQVVESSLKSALNNVGVGDLVEKINKSSKLLEPKKFYNSFNLHDFCIIRSGNYYPSHEIYLDSEEKNIIIDIRSVRVNTDWVYPDIKFLNEYLNTSYTEWSEIIPNSDIVNIVNLFIDALDYLSKKANCLNKYNEFGEFLSGINTEEDLMIKYPEIYEYYLEFKKAYPEDVSNILRSGREVKEILEEYRNYLTLVEEKEEVGN